MPDFEYCQSNCCVLLFTRSSFAAGFSIVQTSRVMIKPNDSILLITFYAMCFSESGAVEFGRDQERLDQPRNS